MGAEERLIELKLVLPPAPKPVATYVTAIRHGDLLYVSGHGPLRADGTLIVGRLGADMDVAAGQAAARHTGLVVGILGGLGNLCAAGFLPLAGSVKDTTGSFAPIFVLVGLLPFVGLAALIVGWGGGDLPDEAKSS